MGPDTKAHDIGEFQLTINGSPIVYDADGNIPTVQICDIAKDGNEEYIGIANPGEFYMTLKPSKKLRCTNKKRFIKLLMSYGVKRNEANIAAKWVQHSEASYQHYILWLWWSTYLPFMQEGEIKK